MCVQVVLKEGVSQAELEKALISELGYRVSVCWNTWTGFYLTSPVDEPVWSDVEYQGVLQWLSHSSLIFSFDPLVGEGSTA